MAGAEKRPGLGAHGNVRGLLVDPMQDRGRGIALPHRGQEGSLRELPRRGDQVDQALARVLALAQDQVAQQAVLLVPVVRRDLLGLGPGPHPRQQRRGLGREQEALLQVEDLVPAALGLHAQLHRGPALPRRIDVPEGELHLVAVVPGLGRGVDPRLRELLYMRQGGADLLGLEPQLLLVSEVLKGAAPAGPEVDAARAIYRAGRT